MTRVAPVVPAETDLLCERCGYVLNGLPADGRCPECGTPLDESVNYRRHPPAWERARGWAKVFTAKPGDADAPETPHLPVQRNPGETEVAGDPDEEQQRGE